jgi:cytochrome c-type biogenesis protein CcmE
MSANGSQNVIRTGRPSDADGLERRSNRVPFLLLGVVVLLTLLSLGFTVFRRAMVYSYTPTEVLSKPGIHLRMNGKVVPGSIQVSAEQGTVEFDVTDGKTTIPVFYRGPAPDTLKDEAQAEVEGSLGTDGRFQAVKVFAKCPSKFSSKEG